MPRMVEQPEYEDLIRVADFADEVVVVLERFLSALLSRDEFRSAVFKPGMQLRQALRKAGYRAEGEIPISKFKGTKSKGGSKGGRDA